MAYDIDKRGQATHPRRSDMAVLLPLRPVPQMDSLSLTTWLAKIRWWQVMLLMLVWPLHAFAQGTGTVDSAVAVLYR